jgi:hypothetical protein
MVEVSSQGRTGIKGMKSNADLIKELESIVVDLERAHRHAEYMRRDMVSLHRMWSRRIGRTMLRS